MDKKNKSKVGLAFFAARWFEEVVLGGSDTSADFNRFVDEDTKKIEDGLKNDFELVTTDIITSMEKARNAKIKFLAEDVDAVILVFLVWSEDEYILAFKDLMKIRPTIVWGYTPYKEPPQRTNIMDLFRNSGIVGTFEGFGVIARMGLTPFYVFGSSLDKGPFIEIEKIVRAAHTYKQLQTARFGVLPYRNNQMIVTYVDEFKLYSQIGPVVDFVSVHQLKKASDSIKESQLDAYVTEIKNSFKIDHRITEENLRNSARVSLGFEKLIFDMGFHGLALSDLNSELHEVVGLRPCLYPKRLAESDIVIGNEGDLGCTTAMFILQRLTGNPVMFTEIFNLSISQNTIGTGHAGPSNYLSADDPEKITITPDFELMDATSKISGVWMEFIGKPGDVTIINFICKNDGFQATILGGESLGGSIRFDGYPHYFIKIAPDMLDFLKSNSANGTSHHWAVVNGDVRKEFEYVADMLQIKKIVLPKS